MPDAPRSDAVTRSVESTPARPPRDGLDRNVVVLGWTSFVNDVASEMIFPLLPVFVRSVLHGNALDLGIMEGVSDTASSLLKLASGAWSDRIRNRKGWIVAGYLLAAVSRPLTGLVGAAWQLVPVRLADRIGKGIRSSPRDALIVDSTPVASRGRAFGFQRAMDHLGAAVGPLLAAAFLAIWPGQLRMLFLMALVPGIAVVLLLWLGLREQAVQAEAQPPAAGGPPTKTPARPGFDRRFWFYLAAVLIFTLGNSSDVFLLYRAGDLGIAATLLPILWFVFHVVKSAGSVAAGPSIDRYGGQVLVLLGWLIYAAVYCGFAVASAAWHIWALFLVYAVFYALTEPAERVLVANFSRADNRGLAFGWFHLATGIANLPASLLFGYLYYRFGARAAFGAGAAFALAASILLVAMRALGRPESSRVS